MTGPNINILPQFQGDYYSLQNKQALAQALMQQSLTPTPLPQAVGSGGSQNYQVMPKYGIGQGISQLAQGLIAAKMQQQAAQGYQNLGQQQMSYLTGGSPQPQQQAAPQQAPQAAPTDAGGMSPGPDGSGAGVQSMPVPMPGQPSPQALAGALGGAQPPQPQSQPAQGQQGGGLLAPGSALNPSGMDQGKAAFLYQTMGPEAYAKEFVAPYVKPTDATLMARQAGVDPAQANAGALFRNNFVAPVTGSGIFRDPRTMQPIANNPNIPANTNPLFDATGNVAAVQPIQGAQAAVQGNAAAQAAGEGSQLPFTGGVDAQGNPLPVMSRTQAATGNLPLPLRNNNPGAVSPNGQVAQYPTMQAGLQAMDGNLAKYASDPKAATIGGAITKWVGSPANAPAYISDVTSRLGVPANTPFDATNPVQRQALSTAIMLHENGPGAVFASGGQQGGALSPAPAASGGAQPIYGAPPLAAQANANATAQGQVDTMQKSYQSLQTVRANAPSALQDIGNMVNLASGKSQAVVGPNMAAMVGLVSPNAAEYEKSRDNLVANLSGQLGMSTDAAHSMVYGSIPGYGAPKQAIANGLQTLQGQVQARMLKANFLSNDYASGNATVYNQHENQFDQNITPAVAGQISTINAMPSGPAKAQALGAAAQDPQLRPRLDWAVQNGILK